MDRLAPPLWLVLQTQNQPVMDETARVLAALKKGIQYGEKVVVKFCHAYIEDAHRLVEKIGFAPRLNSAHKACVLSCR